jgi:bla regulator protein blaR1
MTVALLDHLWQSTLFACMVGLATLFFRNNGAGVRYGLWLAASLKFLFPFALLTMAGRFLFIPIHPSPKLSPLFCDLQPAIQPFLTRAEMAGPHAATSVELVPVLIGIWATGIVAIAATWTVRWLRLRRALQSANDAKIAAPVAVKYAPGCLEPGLIGIFRPVLLLPHGITARLSPEEMQTVIAHEMCHLRRRDNLTAAFHMIVEALVWFHPLVWWIGARLIEERERACDEAVLGTGINPETYAQSILKVYRFYLRSPLASASGVSGADLKRRLNTIMENKIVSHLTPAKRMTLSLAGLAIVMTPLTTGLIESRLDAAQALTISATRSANKLETPPPAVATGPFDRYAGSYQFPDGGILRIFRSGGRYFAEEPSHRRIEIFPNSGRFADLAGMPEVSFEFDAAGRAARIVLRQGDRAYEAKRIGKPTP